jgi:hypothetical protein
MPENMGAASTVNLVLIGGGTHSEGDTNTTHLTLGVLGHKSPYEGVSQLRTVSVLACS